MKQPLAFSHNWNGKLNCRFFTTLRLSGRFEVGQTVEVFWGAHTLGDAVVRSKKSLTASQINEWIAGLDTGYSPDETREILRKMYPTVANWETQVIYLYLLEYTDWNQKLIKTALGAAQKEVGDDGL